MGEGGDCWVKVVARNPRALDLNSQVKILQGPSWDLRTMIAGSQWWGRNHRALDLNSLARILQGPLMMAVGSRLWPETLGSCASIHRIGYCRAMECKGDDIGVKVGKKIPGPNVY